PERALPGVDQRRDRFGRMRLTHRHQGHFVPLAPGEAAGAGDALLGLGETGCCAFHRGRYSGAMPERQTCPEPRRRALPDLWLFSDERNDAGLEDALRRLPPGSGFVFRHYRLAPDERRARFEALAAIGRAAGHAMVL